MNMAPISPGWRPWELKFKHTHAPNSSCLLSTPHENQAPLQLTALCGGAEALIPDATHRP